MNKWPPVDYGTKVTTDISAGDADDWMPEALASRKHNAKGVVVKHHDSHGLCYEVQHEDGTIGHYDPHELVVDES